MSRPAKFKYECIYGSLVGTKFEGKCPDLNIDGKWYEHEGFTTTNPAKAFGNMLKHGLKQSNRLIIDEPELSESYMKRAIHHRLAQGQDIEEIWLRRQDGSLKALYKKFEE